MTKIIMEDTMLLTQVVDEKVKYYMKLLVNDGISVRFAIVYGSSVKDEFNEDNDIDTIIVSPDFDSGSRLKNLDCLWRLATEADNRIEPFPCGEKEWKEGYTSAVIERARREGVQINLE